MPKIIAGVREQLLDEVRGQIEERGYSNVTIRSVADALHISVGTLYNYFKSKDMLVATAVFEDWERATEAVRNSAGRSLEEMIRLLWDTLRSFEEDHRALFTDREAEKKFSSVFSSWHSVLREQTASFLSPFFPDVFTPLFVAESLLCWVTDGIDYETYYTVIEKIIHKENEI